MISTRAKIIPADELLAGPGSRTIIFLLPIELIDMLGSRNGSA